MHLTQRPRHPSMPAYFNIRPVHGGVVDEALKAHIVSVRVLRLAIRKRVRLQPLVQRALSHAQETGQDERVLGHYDTSHVELAYNFKRYLSDSKNKGNVRRNHIRSKLSHGAATSTSISMPRAQRAKKTGETCDRVTLTATRARCWAVTSEIVSLRGKKMAMADCSAGNLES